MNIDTFLPTWVQCLGHRSPTESENLLPLERMTNVMPLPSWIETLPWFSALRGMSSITVATNLAMNCGMTRELQLDLTHTEDIFINDTCLFESKTLWKVNNIAALFFLVKEIRKFAFFQCPKYLLCCVWSSLSLSVLMSLPFHFSYYCLNFLSLNFVSLLNPSPSFPNSFSLK